MKSAPNSFLRTGFIVGHPGESEADFEELCEFVKDFGFDRVSVLRILRKKIQPLLIWSKCLLK